MTTGPKNTQENEMVFPPHKMESGGIAPTSKDIKAMHQKTKEMRGCDVLWIWFREGRTYTLTGNYRYFKDREWWDYELRDDPMWTLADDRKQGNPIIWEYKTGDLELVQEIVNMVGASSHADHDVAEDREASQLDFGATPIFPEYSSQNAPDTVNQKQVASVLQYLASTFYTGKVEFRRGDDLGEVFLDAGVVRHARLPFSKGDAAVRELISWQFAADSYGRDEKAEEISVTWPLNALMREGLSQFECKRYLANLGLTYESCLVATQQRMDDAQLVALPPQQKKVLGRLHKPRTVFDIIRDLEEDSSEWAPFLYFLLVHSFAAVKPPEPTAVAALQFLHKTESGVRDLAIRLSSAQTGILGYEALLFYLQREFEWYREHGDEFSLVVLHMEPKGEEGAALRMSLPPQTALTVAHRIKYLKRPLDVFAHFGTFDFALLLPHTNLRQAMFVGQTIIKSLAGLEEQGIGLSVSCGLASMPTSGVTVPDLLASVKVATNQAREKGKRIVVAQADQIMASRGSGEHVSYASFDTKELLIRAGLVSPDNFEQAKILTERSRVPLGRALSLEGHIQETTVEAAEQLTDIAAESGLSMDLALRALKLVGNHGVDLETAMRRLGVPRHRSKFRPFAEFLYEASVADQRQLKHALFFCAVTGLPVGRALVQLGSLSNKVLYASLAVAMMTRERLFSRKEGIEFLREVRLKPNSLKKRLYDRGYNRGVLDNFFTVDRLLVEGNILVESQLMAAKEIAYVERVSLEQVLTRYGFVGQVTVHTMTQLCTMIKNGKVSAPQAAQIMRNSKLSKSTPDLQAELQIVKDQQETSAKAASVLKILLDTGVFKQYGMELSEPARKRIESGDLDKDQIVTLLKYCREHLIGFDEALDLFGWSSVIPA